MEEEKIATSRWDGTAAIGLLATEASSSNAQQSILSSNDTESLDLDVALIPDDLRAGQLGTAIFRNMTVAEQSSPRELVTAKELRHFYFHVRFQSARYGTFARKPACLIVLDFSFQKSGSTMSRFQHAEIDVEFEDGVTVTSNPHGDDIEDEEEDEERDALKHQPRVLSFEPRNYQGPVASGQGHTMLGAQISLSPPGGIVSLTPSISKQTPFVKEGYFKAHGTVRDNPPSRVHLSMDENEMTHGGIRAEMSLAMIVNYTPGRKFAARVRVKCDLYLRLLRPMCGEKDEPIWFDPQRMRRKGAANSQTKVIVGEGERARRTVPGVESEELEAVDLKNLTRLGVIGGIFA